MGLGLFLQPDQIKKYFFRLYLSNLQLSSNEDSYIWQPNAIPSTKYVTSVVYVLLKDHGPIVPWKTVVWNYRGIPRHNFLTWLFILDRCPTRDRLLTWGLQTNPMCILCNSAPESRDHLFFLCDYSWTIWEWTLRRCHLPPLRSWNSTLLHLQSLSGSKAFKALATLAFQCSVYVLWNERNNRIHNRLFTPTAALRKTIDITLRNRISSFRNSLLLKSFSFGSIPLHLHEI